MSWPEALVTIIQWIIGGVVAVMLCLLLMRIL
jgi:hypothetical protein